MKKQRGQLDEDKAADEGQSLPLLLLLLLLLLLVIYSAAGALASPMVVN